MRTMCAKHRPQKGNRGGGLGMRRSYEYTFKRLMIIASCILAMELSEKTPACLIGMASWRLRLTALTYRSSAQHSKKIRRISRRLLLPGAAVADHWQRSVAAKNLLLLSQAYSRSTIGVHSEYIRSTIGIQSEYVKIRILRIRAF